MALQPQSKYQDTRTKRRRIDEFIGLCRAIIDDGKVGEDEIRTLDRWFDRNGSIIDAPLVEVIHDLVGQAFYFNFSPGSCEEVRTGLEALCGAYGAAGRLEPTTLPLDDPPPPIIFPGKRYCFTGTFRYGTRNVCEETIRDLGGIVGPISTLTDYLVIGSFATDAWTHSSYGSKITKAVTWRDEGYPIAIVSEDHWRASLPPATQPNPNSPAPGGPSPNSPASTSSGSAPFVAPVPVLPPPGPPSPHSGGSIVARAFAAWGLTAHQPGAAPDHERITEPCVSKQDAVLKLLRRTDGASLEELMAATAWQPHSVRGFISGTVKNRMRLSVISERTATGERRYRVE